MKKVTLLAALLGVLVALALGLLSLYEHHHPGNTNAILDMPSAVALWLWPTGLMLIETSENRTGFIMWGISAVANGVIYGIAGFSISWLWKEIATPKAVREANQTGWWPTKPSDR